MTGHVTLEQLAEARTNGRPDEAIEAHVKSCKDCSRLADQLDAVAALLADVPTNPMPPSVSESLSKVIQAEVVRRDQSAGLAAAREDSERPRRNAGAVRSILSSGEKSAELREV